PHLAGNLWPDSNEAHAHASLRSALWRLRTAGSCVVSSSGQMIGLDAGVAVDYRESSDLAWGLISNADLEVQLDAGIAKHALIQDILPGWYEEWALFERERFRQLRLHALECLCDRLRQQGRFAEAVEVGYTVLASEPLR